MAIPISISYARRNMGQILDRVDEGERFVVQRHGKPVAAVISASDAESLRRYRKKGPVSNTQKNPRKK